MITPYAYDLLIIGSGPGGYVAAIRASQLGLKTAVIEKDKIGGVCLNVGCIPSKSLIHQAGLYRSIRELEDMGLEINQKNFRYEKVWEKSRAAADTLSKGVQFLLKKNKVDVIPGTAVLSGEHEVQLQDGRKISARFILIATGSSPREIPDFPFDEDTVLSSTGMLMLKDLPEKLLILGGGAIGIEFAYVMNAFGVSVHLVEMLDQILPLEDEETVEVLRKSLIKQGIRISTGTRALSMKKQNGLTQVTLEEKNGTKKVVEVNKILSAVGRIPNTRNIGLENVGLETQRGFIPVQDYYQTKVPSIYAIGDVVNTPLLAHVASKEGEIAVEHMAGHRPPSRIDPHLIPSAVYCEPQLAGFGYTEKEAAKEGIPYRKSVFPYRGAGKAVAIGRSEGMVKVLYHPSTGEILGAHIVGAEATELIHELLLAKSSELLPEDIASLIHAHPTLSESVMEAMRGAEGWAIHI